MNSDAKPDLVWQHAGNGQLAAWLYDGTTRIGTPSIATEPDLAWRVMAAADLNNDGHADLVWQNVATGALRVWHMNALVKVDSVPLALNVGTSGWELAGVGDMDGDGHRDLVWRNYSTGGNAAWLMADTTVLQTLNVFPSPTTPADWRIVAVADMNRDGQTDLVWQHITDGRLAIWYMSGLTMVASDYLVNSPLPAADRPYWRIVGGK